ncbi:putative Major facilitator superfamily domain-containing protein 1 [Hypsibius exemplaris]|uniref:Lysosomal dipeptide transporter MFSD1 n=1 Tax=Hypsibius exemplaris TaxID=2072580 RepID=A0A1W0WQ47_HYPEX|nr:putative Major facilitator superfamily domain-containing protein 1 [Hypsibius exemplaris]
MDTRWWVLIFCAVNGFCTDFFFEEPSVLVQRLIGTAEACVDGTDACLSLNLLQFNLIYSANSWSSAVAAIFAGLLIDRHGSEVSLCASAALVFIGSLMFALGAYSSDSSTAFAVMLVGSLITGLGSGAAVVIMHRLKAFWFLYRELALAFSVHILMGRLGSAVCFVLLGSIVRQIGLRSCLWLGFVVILFSAGSLVALAFIDQREATLLSSSPTLGSGKAGVVQRIKQLDGMFWCFVATIFFFYGTTNSFIANGPNFIATQYGFSEAAASIITGIVYDIALLAPLSGWLTDRYGNRQHWLIGTSILLFIGLLLLYLAPTAPPGIFILLIGMGYTCYAPTIWSSIPLIVPPDAVGLAMGLGKFFHFIGAGSLIAGAGGILNMQTATSAVPWDSFLIYLICIAATCCLVCMVVIYLNRTGGRLLTPSQKERDQGNVLSEYTPLRVDYGGAGQRPSKSGDELTVSAARPRDDLS